MKHKLKHLKLFEGLSVDEIPYLKVNDYGSLYIKLPKTVKQIPPEYNQLTDEITGNLLIKNNPHITKLIGFDNLTTVTSLYIESNPSLTEITGFNNLTGVSDLSIKSNPSLTEITGFNNLIRVGWNLIIESNQSLTKIIWSDSLTIVRNFVAIEYNPSLTEIIGFNNLTRIWCALYIRNNPKLVTMSIPSNMIRAVNYDDGYSIVYDNDLRFKSPGDFINSPEIMDDLVTRFNPGDHGDLVVKQIMENVEEWGTEETKSKVYSFLGKYLTPEQWKLVPDRIKHLYHPDYQGTTGRDVAKVNSGEVYGIF